MIQFEPVCRSDSYASKASTGWEFITAACRFGDEGVQLFAIRAGAEDFDDVGAGFEGYGGGEYAGYVNGYGYAVDGDDRSCGGASDEGDGGMDCKSLVQRLGNYQEEWLWREQK